MEQSSSPVPLGFLFFSWFFFLSRNHLERLISFYGVLSLAYRLSSSGHRKSAYFLISIRQVWKVVEFKSVIHGNRKPWIAHESTRNNQLFSLRSKRFQSSYPSFPSPSPVIHFFFLLLSQLSRPTSRGNACYAGYQLLFIFCLKIIRWASDRFGKI